MKLHIYLFRHGQTTYNRNKRFTGFHNPPLTPLGIKQAKTIAKKLKNKKCQIGIQTSLTRSKQTIKEVLKYHPECKKILTEDRMIERNYGTLNGTTHQQLIQKKGLVYYKKIHRDYNTIPPKGESFKMVETRVQSFIKDLKKLMKKTNSNILISAHGNSIRLFRKIMEKASQKKAVKWIIPYDSFYQYTLNL